MANSPLFVNQSLSAKTTHDLWVEAREFTVQIARPSPTTIQLTITRPTNATTADGALVLLATSPLSADNYPQDGTQYVPSADLNAPADMLGGAQVVGFYSNILELPFPTQSVIDTGAQTTTTTLTITNALPNQIYYASVHAMSNALQYYPIGVQSYPLPLDGSVKNSSTFTGSIPSLASAPLSPTVGTVYFDQQLNVVQYWTGTAWISTRTDSILTGDVYPGVQGQTYLLSGSELMTFNGTVWVRNDSSNTQFRVGTSWVPMKGCQATVQAPQDPAIGDFYWDYTQQRGFYWDGSTWNIPSAQNSLFNTGSTLVPAFIVPISLEPMALPNPWLGQLFYNTSTRTLDAWTGTAWKQANTDQQGVVMYNKVGVGDDGSYDQRIALINILKNQLGWPQNCVELTEDQFNVGIENALNNYRLWSDGAYKHAYIMYPLIPNQQVYYLNSKADKTDRIVDVVKIHRLNMVGIQGITGNDAIWSSGILTSYYSTGTVDILSIHLLASLGDEFQRIFAGDLTFLWDEATRELMLTRKVSNNEKIILEVNLEKSEQEIFQDRWSCQFIQNWALAELKYMLGIARSKFTSGTPGAAGTITLNGELLIAEANQDMAELKQECQLDYGFGGHVNQGNVSFLIG